MKNRFVCCCVLYSPLALKKRSRKGFLLLAQLLSVETQRERLMFQRAALFSSIPLMVAANPLPHYLTDQQKCCRVMYPTRNKGTACRNQQSTCRLGWDCFSVVQAKRGHVAFIPFYKWEIHRRVKGVSQAKDLCGTLRALTTPTEFWISKWHWNHTPCSVLSALKCRNEFILF